MPDILAFWSLKIYETIGTILALLLKLIGVQIFVGH